ncbi:MAG TPA: TIGR03621 family F420-dependent LLM class oxidoreductase [Acidimicrobiia bacterium]|nr:TIGR03621 family F420-dependent LLM class oxidoreductase [Acidimicrobiia bacterium]
MSTVIVRPFRFGFTGGASSKRARLLESARAVEALGYSTFGLADHFVRPFAPLVAGQAVADATTSLRVTQTVLAQDFRQPAVLAKELATLDVLSEGRVEVGLGAGWLQKEYEDAGLRFEAAPVRIARLEETAIILKGLFGGGPFTFTGEHYQIAGLEGAPRPVQQPRPPIMIGGGAKLVLSVAARQADIVQLMPSNPKGRSLLDETQFSAGAIEEKIGWIRDAAGSRFDGIELSAQLLECAVTEQPERHLSDFAERIATVTERMGGARVEFALDDLRNSPIVAVGSLDEVCETLVETRSKYGISYFSAPIDARPDVLAPVIERLAGN